jgi:ribose-phosphate pyrophosphokinase
MLVLGFTDYEIQGRRLARFPDGETKVTLPTELPERLIICRSLNAPNNKLIEILFTVEAAREQGVKEITLVAPYLCYMRQDIAFHPGEAVSQRIIGGFLARLFDQVITVDAHLHRIDTLDQALPGIRAINLSAAPLFCEFLNRQAGQVLLIGPDSESAQWVEAIADRAGCPFAVADKRRLGDRKVEITLPEYDYSEKRIILVDDVISTGHTLMRITEALNTRGVASVDALVTHALFYEAVGKAMRKAGIGNIWSTDSISHPSNALHLDQLLAGAIGNSA